MLLPQIPLKAKQKITSEIGFDIKILSGKIKTERDSLDDRVSRLLVVERYLRDTQRIGSLREPAPWISDAQEVDFGILPSPGGMVGFIGHIRLYLFPLGRFVGAHSWRSTRTCPALYVLDFADDSVLHQGSDEKKQLGSHWRGRLIDCTSNVSGGT